MVVSLVMFISTHPFPTAMDRVRLGLSTPTFVDTIDEFLERTAPHFTWNLHSRRA